MSRVVLSIPKLSGVVTLAVHVLDMLEALHKAYGSDTGSVNLHIGNTFDLQQRLIQELLVLQQEQDLVLAVHSGGD